MMRGELWRYSRRELNNVLSVSGDEQFRSIILMLKVGPLHLVTCRYVPLLIITLNGDERFRSIILIFKVQAHVSLRIFTHR